MGLQLATEADSMKYFPASNSSREVRDRMLAACRRLGVEVQCKAPVMGLSRDAESRHWRLRLEDGSEHCSSRVVSLLSPSCDALHAPDCAVFSCRCSRPRPALHCQL